MRRDVSIVISAAILLGVNTIARAQATNATPETTLPKAHSHNDYYHERPLLDALDHGFCSVEADVFLVDGELLVGHDRDELRPERSLEALYLEPLADRIANNGGHVHREPTDFMLLVDFKNDGEASFLALQRLLKDYAPILSKTVSGKFEAGPVEVVVSGDRPWDAMVAEPNRLAAYDGRVADLSDPARRDVPPELMPLVSDHWFSQFTWYGNRPMPSEERQKLRRIVKTAHEQGRRVRFWATPESEDMWRELEAAGVDHINTDQHARLRRFLQSESDQTD